MKICAVELVNKGMINPASHFFPPNQIPWERAICPLCNKEDNLSEHPEIKSIQEDNVVIVKDEFNRGFK